MKKNLLFSLFPKNINMVLVGIVILANPGCTEKPVKPSTEKPVSRLLKNRVFFVWTVSSLVNVLLITAEDRCLRYG